MTLFYFDRTTALLCLLWNLHSKSCVEWAALLRTIEQHTIINLCIKMCVDNEWHKGVNKSAFLHYCDVIMVIVSQITSLTIVYSTVYSDADQRKHQSSASLALVRGIRRGPVNSPHKGPVTQQMFLFDDVIMRVFSISLKTWVGFLERSLFLPS